MGHYNSEMGNPDERADEREALKKKLDELHAAEEKAKLEKKKQEDKEAADADAFFREGANKIAAAQLQRSNDEKRAEEYLARKLEADRIIKSLIEQRLEKAKKVGGDKAKRLSLEHFVMIGGGHGVDDLQSYVGHKLGFSHLKHGKHLLCLRIETQPGVCTFLVGKADRYPDKERELIKTLITSLRQYMKPYVEMEPDRLQIMLEQ